MLKSPFVPRDPKDFKILIFLSNLHMSALMPQSVGIFTALLKREGYQLDLFDCTYYEDIDSLTLGKNTNEEKVENRNVHKYNNKEWHEKGVKPKSGIVEDFKKNCYLSTRPNFGISFGKHLLFSARFTKICT